MYSTKHGAFNGDSWEDIMQICFRLKYETEHYTEIPASSGDCGIEGFTRSGKVFQCYCPDNNLPSSDLYEKQRDKITKDLKKLSTYQSKLGQFFNGTKINEWIFVTPDYRTNDLVIHCNSKTQEVIDCNLPFIDPTNFQVIVHTIDNFARELPIALSTNGQKLIIEPGQNMATNVTQWKEQQISLVDNAIRKHTKRFESGTNSIDSKVNKLTEATIKSYFDRESILGRWRNLNPQDYERYLVLISQTESEVEEQCMFPTADNDARYMGFRALVKEKLQSNFQSLDETTITILTHGAVADWLLRCPLDFE